jgi:hypothetical protein
LCCNLYDIERVLNVAEPFDIVFTSYGAINWLPDLRACGKIIAHYLRAGGFFYIVEAHPSARMFPMEEDLKQAEYLRPWFSYFHDSHGIRWPGSADYANPSAVHGWVATVYRNGDIQMPSRRGPTSMAARISFCAWPLIAGCTGRVVHQARSHAVAALEPQYCCCFRRARKG